LSPANGGETFPGSQLVIDTPLLRLSDKVSVSFSAGDQIMYEGGVGSVAEGGVVLSVPSTLAAGDYTLLVQNEHVDGTDPEGWWQVSKGLRLSPLPDFVEESLRNMSSGNESLCSIGLNDIWSKHDDIAAIFTPEHLANVTDSYLAANLTLAEMITAMQMYRAAERRSTRVLGSLSLLVTRLLIEEVACEQYGRAVATMDVVRRYQERTATPAAEAAAPPAPPPINLMSMMSLHPTVVDLMPTAEDLMTPPAPPASPPAPIATLSTTLAVGWNWFSLNVVGDDMSVGAVFSGATFSLGDPVKSHSAFTNWYGAENGFFGVLLTLNPDEMYAVHTTTGSSVRYAGVPVSLPKTIALAVGWTWIPNPYQTPVTLTDGAPTFSYSSGDQYKSYTQFSEYYEGYGWYGTLSSLSPGEGYKVKTAVSGPAIFQVQ